MFGVCGCSEESMEYACNRADSITPERISEVTFEWEEEFKKVLFPPVFFFVSVFLFVPPFFLGLSMYLTCVLGMFGCPLSPCARVCGVCGVCQL